MIGNSENTPLDVRIEYVLLELSKVIETSKGESDAKSAVEKIFSDLKTQGIISEEEKEWQMVVNRAYQQIEQIYHFSVEDFDRFISEYFFEMLGLKNIEAHERLLFQQLLISSAWNSFLLQAVREHLSDAQIIELRKLQKIDKYDIYSENSRAKIHLSGVLSNIDELIQEEITNIRKNLLLKRLSVLNIDRILVQDMIKNGYWQELKKIFANGGAEATFDQLLEWLDEFRVKTSSPDDFDVELGRGLSELLVQFEGAASADALEKHTALSLFEVGEWRRGKKIMMKILEK